MMFLDEKIALSYKSPSQKARVMTESWAGKNIFCPSCGNSIIQHNNNKPVADFFCESCNEDFELKAKKSITLGKIVPDGAYGTMIDRLESSTNPSFFFLTYKPNLEISNFLVIPKFFIRPENIIKAPRILKDRGEYIMCNISLLGIPESGKIFYIQNGEEIKKKLILETWQKTCFLNEQKGEKKGWSLEIMKCIEMINKKEFNLDDINKFEPYLREKYPNNNFILDKIRQQLQFLRDKGYIGFLGRGRYKVI